MITPDDGLAEIFRSLERGETYGAAVLLAPCAYCGRVHTFDPDRCPSVFVDPRAKLVADDPAGLPDAREHAQREPVCEECKERVKAANRAAGIPIYDDPAWQ